MAEESPSFGTALTRVLLRNNRPFTITVLDTAGVVLFRVRRPAYLITSSVFIENGVGDVVGEVHQRWHLWRRNYDLYVDKRQFAAIRSGFLSWDFELHDEVGRPLAKIDRNFSGFGIEILTDAGTYVVHFAKALKGGLRPDTTAQQQTADPSATAGAASATGVTVQSSLWSHPGTSSTLSAHGPDTWQPPALARTLGLSERAIALAAAVSIDFDYFSRHSFGGFGMPIIVPMPSGESSDTTEPEGTAEAQAKAHDEMMEAQKGTGVGGAMGAVGMDAAGRGFGGEKGPEDGPGGVQTPGGTRDEEGDAKDDFWSGWGDDDKDDDGDDGGDDGDGGGGGLAGFLGSILSQGDSD